jgi:hypothetical protein
MCPGLRWTSLLIGRARDLARLVGLTAAAGATLLVLALFRGSATL